VRTALSAIIALGSILVGGFGAEGAVDVRFDVRGAVDVDARFDGSDIFGAGDLCRFSVWVINGRLVG
jgi:hypothetical protein